MRIKKGQSVMETAVLVLVIVGALIAMQVYLKRGIQGRLRGGVDSIGEQYDPQATSSSFAISHDSSAITTTNIVTVPANVWTFTAAAGNTVAEANVIITDTRSETLYDNTTRTGYEAVANP